MAPEGTPINQDTGAWLTIHLNPNWVFEWSTQKKAFDDAHIDMRFSVQPRLSLGVSQLLIPSRWGLPGQAIIALGSAEFISPRLLVENTLTPSLCVGAFAGSVIDCTYDLSNLSRVRD